MSTRLFIASMVFGLLGVAQDGRALQRPVDSTRTPAQLHRFAAEFHLREHHRFLPWEGTMAPAANRGIDVVHYDLHITAEPSLQTITGVATLTITLLEQATTPTLDLVGMTVDFVRVDGLAASFVRGAAGQDPAELLAITLAQPRPAGDTLNVVVTYHGTPVQPSGFVMPNVGFAFGTSPAAVFTLNEPYYARTWFPCHDQPWDKATMSMTVDVPTGWKVASNGVLGSVTTGVGTDRWTWATQHQITSYLISIAAAEYAVLEDQAGDLPLVHYVYPEQVADAQAVFASVPDMIAAFSERFGPYPWEKYGHAVAPIGGGMENQSITTLDPGVVHPDGEMVIAHELAHQWWGDLVTMADWPHIWLNEGFATFSEAVWFEASRGPDAYRQYLDYMMENALQAEEWEGPHALYDPPGIFTWTVYQKGGRVLGMLRDLMGDEAFFSGMQDYATRHREGNASTEDFQAVMEEHAGWTLDWFFAQWIYLPGHPVVEVTYNSRPDGTHHQVDLRFTQTQQTGVYRLPVYVEIHSANGQAEVMTLDVTENPQTFSLCVPNTVSQVLVDRGSKIYWEVTVGADPLLALPAGACSASPDAGVQDGGEASDASVVEDGGTHPPDAAVEDGGVQIPDAAMATDSGGVEDASVETADAAVKADAGMETPDASVKDGSVHIPDASVKADASVETPDASVKADASVETPDASVKDGSADGGDARDAATAVMDGATGVDASVTVDASAVVPDASQTVVVHPPAGDDDDDKQPGCLNCQSASVADWVVPALVLVVGMSRMRRRQRN